MENNTLILSIIVPIYNVESYLSKCIESLLCQNLSAEEYEIVLIDDGSTDRSGHIADDYAQQYANIKVVHQQNAGLSEARNAGVAQSSGQYIMFVDSDDYLQPNVLKSLTDKMIADKLDVLRFNYQNVDESGVVVKPNKVDKAFADYSDKLCNGLTFLNERLGIGCYACMFVITRQLAQIRFSSGRYFEDSDWTPRVMLGAKRVTSTNLLVYNYLVRTGSITKSVSKEKKQKVIDDKIWLISRIKEFARQADDKRWFEGMVANTVIGVLTSVAKDDYENREQVLAKMRELQVFPLSDYMLTKYALRKRFLINLSPRLYMFLQHRLKG